MKLRQLFIAATVALGLGLSFHASAYDYQSVKGDMMQSRIYTLKNGLTVYLSVNKEKPRIQTYIAVRTGSRNDPHETTGLAHYLEHLMFKGTQQFGTSDYQKELPYLNDIERRYEEYRLVTDPALPPDRQRVAVGSTVQHTQRVRQAHVIYRSRRYQRLHLQRCDLLRGGHTLQRGRELGTHTERPFPEHGHPRIPHRA